MGSLHALQQASNAIKMAARPFRTRRPPCCHLVAHPVGADTELIVAEQEVVDIVLAVLTPYGLQGDDAIHAVRALRSVAHGFATLEAAGGFGLSLDTDESFRRLIDMFIAGLRQRSHATGYAPPRRRCARHSRTAEPRDWVRSMSGMAHDARHHTCGVSSATVVRVRASFSH